MKKIIALLFILFSLSALAQTGRYTVVISGRALKETDNLNGFVQNIEITGSYYDPTTNTISFFVGQTAIRKYKLGVDVSSLNGKTTLATQKTECLAFTPEQFVTAAGGGAGGGTPGGATSSGQIDALNAANATKDTLKKVLDVAIADAVKQDTANARLLRMLSQFTGGTSGSGVSDSAFIKLNTQTLKDSLHALIAKPGGAGGSDSVFIKQNTDTLTKAYGSLKSIVSAVEEANSLAVTANDTAEAVLNVLKDSLHALIVKPSGGSAGSDSNFIKANTQAIRDSSIRHLFNQYVEAFKDSLHLLISKPGAAGVSDSSFIKSLQQTFKDSLFALHNTIKYNDTSKIGTVIPTWTTLTNATATLSLTNATEIWVQNIGTGPATITAGGVALFPLSGCDGCATPSQYVIRAERQGNTYVPFETHSIAAPATTVVYKIVRKQ